MPSYGTDFFTPLTGDVGGVEVGVVTGITT